MSWLLQYSVALPGFHVRERRVFFEIELRATATGEHVMQARSYSEFRTLWKLLLRVTKPVGEQPKRRRLAQWLPVLEAGCACEHLAGESCPFQPLRHLLRALRFPARQIGHTQSVRRIASVVQTRRLALEKVLQVIAMFLARFPEAVLRQKLLRGDCKVLQAYAAFVGAPQHFPSQWHAVIRQPLSLQGWRSYMNAQIVDAHLRKPSEQEQEQQPEGEDDMRVIATSSNDYDLDISSFRKAPCLTDKLPCLDVKPLNVETMQSFMEDFCHHLLEHYGQDLTELSSPDLTVARRWELCLYVACLIGHNYAVQLILFYYADANTAIDDGSTCLSIASRMGHVSIMQTLIDEGADVNIANEAGITPLIAACRNGCVEAVRLLLTTGASVSARSQRGTHPLHAAIVAQNVPIVELLLLHGADVNVTTSSGITPLHFAAKLGNAQICELLLQRHADIELRTKNDSDAMMIASANGHAAVCELLQRYLAKLSIETTAKEAATYKVAARKKSDAGTPHHRRSPATILTIGRSHSPSVVAA
ncbi:TPA: hypothetical protein N0F65_002252 [Lagenidium giganteum]|uniref:Uncharacterized protein n=1 Tax=Lagenidium giganteum TaxID=4803 RepID=A0AAV2YQL5_9STRA|nr:TPA: hypothetical protein N0F65_002252 [Lagenidium giganteum]